MALLDIERLSLTIGGKPILKEISLSLAPGRITGLVGESGSGKSLTALSVMQLLPHASRLSGSIRFDGRELTGQDEASLCQLRGDDIGMVFQEPMTALNPLKTIGEQVAEGIRLHARAGRREANERAAAILARVGLDPAKFPLSRYPHELSGGQRQRVVIAMACAMRPRLLIADEPTTALDVIVQAKILHLLKELVEESGTALLLISHDLAVVADIADDIVIMRGGEIMEQGPAIEVLKARRHPYTARLAEASTHVPAGAGRWQKPEGRTLVEIRGLTVEYPGRRKSLFRPPEPFVAVEDAGFDIRPGEILGLVGESGSGKTTLSRCILGLMTPKSGSIRFEGKEIGDHESVTRRDIVKFVQAVFQDPYGSFNPRHRAERLVSEPLFLRRELSPSGRRDLAAGAMERVGLTTADLSKYPHEFSGGQRQRLAIARAIVNDPKLILADEPVSALDVSIRAQILDLIVELRERLGLAWLFVSHDLSVVRALCDNVMVMRHGRIVEKGPVGDIYARSQHPYTAELVASAPDLQTVLARRRQTSRP